MTGAMNCIARPTPALLGRLSVMYPERTAPSSGNVTGVFDDLVKVDALADSLTRAINACRTTDGRLDERVVG